MPTIRSFASLATLAAGLAAGAAHAGEPELRWSVTIGSPRPAVVAPVRVAVHGLPRAHHPRQAPPARVAYHAPAPRWDRDRDGIPDRYERRMRWDADGDGIPNHRDRVYNPRWDRDGDGIPNRHDPYPHHPNRSRGR